MIHNIYGGFHEWHKRAGGKRMTAKLADMIGVTMAEVSATKNGDVMRFTAQDGRVWELSHSQNCCESVRIEDIVGNLQDLVGVPLFMAYESVNSQRDLAPQYADSWTWTFYKFATVKGYVDVRWLGESNGYYSESVDFSLVKRGLA